MAIDGTKTTFNCLKPLQNLTAGEGNLASTTWLRLSTSTEVTLHQVQVLIQSYLEQSTPFGCRINPLCGIKGLDREYWPRLNLSLGAWPCQAGCPTPLCKVSARLMMDVPPSPF